MRSNSYVELREQSVMMNRYEASEVIEIGKASDQILGSSKGLIFDDGPAQPKRNEPTSDDD